MTDSMEKTIKERRFDALMSILTDDLPELPGEVRALRKAVDDLHSHFKECRSTSNTRFNILEGLLEKRFEAYKELLDRKMADLEEESVSEANDEATSQVIQELNEAMEDIQGRVSVIDGEDGLLSELKKELLRRLNKIDGKGPEPLESPSRLSVLETKVSRIIWIQWAQIALLLAVVSQIPAIQNTTTGKFISWILKAMIGLF